MRAALHYYRFSVARSRQRGTWPKKRDAPLPGGDIGNFDIFLGDVRRRYPFLTAGQSYRVARAYGSMLHSFVQPDMGENLGGDARNWDWY
jgi:glycerol-3-phosphate dehydrogenase